MNVKLEQISKNLAEAIKSTAEKGTQPYDTPAKVVRIDGETAWVHISGGVDETPVKKTINCKVGDTVQIRISGGTATITGNVTSPPTDDTKVIEVEKKTDKIAKGVETIGEIAGNTNQYFWHTERGTDTGAHITEIPREEFLRDPENGGGNLLARSNGIAVRDGLNELATFGADGTQIGASESAHTVVTDRKMQISYGETNLANFYISNDADGISRDNRWQSASGNGDTITLSVHIYEIDKVEYQDGTEITNYSVSQDGYTVTVPSRDTTKIVYVWFSTDTPIPHYLLGTYKTGDRLGYYSFHQGRRCSASGMYASSMGYDNSANGTSSHTHGEKNTADGARAHAEGYNNTASGNDSHAEGDSNTVSGNNAHVEGYNNTASGINSHAEGESNTASYNDAHAEGYNNTASGESTHAEGYENQASGYGSHAEGAYNVASGNVSHVGGYHNIAQGNTQTVIGHWNVAQGTPDRWVSSDHAFIIGNGSDDEHRSNAFSVTWGGDVYINSNKLADFIVEQGTSGIWTYRKWDSGIAECWGATTIRATTSTASGQINYSEGIRVDLPFTMSDWDYVINAICGSYMMYLANYSRSKAYFTIRLCRIGSAIPTATDIDVLFDFKGRWK